MNSAWHTIAIKDLGRVVTGRTPSSNNPELFGRRYPFITPSDIGLDNRHIETERYVSEKGKESFERILLPKGAICFVCIGATIGKICVTSRPSFTNHQINSVVVDESEHDSRFAFYALSLQGGNAKALAGGAATPIINKSAFSEIEIKVPSLPTQRKIAGILSAYDDLIENNLRRIKILEEMAQSLYREWFVHFRFPGHESVKFVDSPLGQIPEGWEVKKLGELADQMRRGVPKGELDEPAPYVGLEHIPRQSLALNSWEETTELGSNKLTFERGEILFGKIRPYFHKVSVAPFDGICSADTIVIRSKKSEHRGLVTSCVFTEAFVAHATATSNGSKMPRTDWKVLKDYLLVLPPKNLLSRFSALFENSLSQQQNLIFRNQTLRQTRDLLLPKLLSQ